LRQTRNGSDLLGVGAMLTVLGLADTATSRE